MLDIDLTTIDDLLKGSGVTYKVKLYLTAPEEYTNDDYLQSIGSIRTGMSTEGSYEIANTEVVLNNFKVDNVHYFSERFEDELPVDKLVEIFAMINGSSVLIFRGIVASWKLTPEEVRLQINA
jgi:hypothetical protein